MTRLIVRWIAAAGFVLIGVDHLLRPAPFRAIVPPSLPRPDWLVAVSGIAEIAGGVGLLVPVLRYSAGWGLLALLVAVFPANLYMAVSNDPRVTFGLPRWVLWARLPLQPVMAVVVAWVAGLFDATGGRLR